MNILNHKFYKVLILGLLVVIGFSCGRMGSHEDTENKSGGDDASRRGVVSVTKSTVIGSFSLSNNTVETSSLQLWILNHTESSLMQIPVDSEGSFTISISKFLEGSVYTSHLVTDDFREIGMIDISSNLDGMQSAFKYVGGVGFNFGEMAVALDKEGKLESGAAISGAVGGGFGVELDADLTINSFKFPSYVESALVSSSLIINNTSVLLNSFYLRKQNSSAFARDLEKYTAIYAQISTNESDAIDRVSVFRTSRWLESSRLVQDFSSGVETSQLWSLNSYTFNKDSDTKHSASVFSGKVVNADSIVLLSIVPTSRAAQFIGPRVIRSAFTMPPQITAISLNESPTVAVDYLDREAENGLNRPFCLGSDDVKLDIYAPQDQQGEYVSHTKLDTIRTKIYYYIENAGALETVEVVSSDLGSVYEQDTIDSSLDDITRYWQVSSKELKFVLGDTVGSNSMKSIRIPIDLFVGSTQGKQISKIKIKIIFEDSQYTDVSGSVVWFDTDC